MRPEENRERHRAKGTSNVVEIIDQENDHRIENINSILDIGNGKVAELISYNQHLEHLETAQDNDFGYVSIAFKVQSHHLTPRSFGSNRSRLEGQPILCSNGLGHQGGYF